MFLGTELEGAAALLSAAEIDTSVRVDVPGLAPETGRLLAWAVREGVTNILRHSRARTCSITVVVSGPSVQLVEGSDRDAVAAYLTEQERLGATGTVPIDEAQTRCTMRRAVDRSTDVRCLFNHFAVLCDEGVRGRLEEITAPTLVLHGDEDPAFPPAHGAALAAEIPRARFLPLPRTGHELPRQTWDTAVPDILRHTSNPR